MNLYFLEMNTRLQVEHPVTELVTGFDLVADQIRIASGLEIGYGQEAVMRRGWAIECRIVAEDPREGFVPSVGSIEFAQEPAGPGVRVESALYDGFEVSPYYDALVAKVTAWGRDRREAIHRMRRALGEFKIAGVMTNIPMHLQVMRSEDFLEGQFSTTFLETALDLNEPTAPASDREAALVAAAVLVFSGQSAGRLNGAGTSSASAPAHPWRSAGRRAAFQSGGAVIRGGGWRSPAR
jgi:acetyl/propionyl-CoA carboxylase alpha subunit